MAIDTVRLKNFSVFSDLTLKVSPGVNILIGENGTGKTHFLKAVYAACTMSCVDIEGNFIDFFTLGPNNALLGKNKLESSFIEVTVANSDGGNQVMKFGYAQPLRGRVIYGNPHHIDMKVNYEVSYPTKSVQAVYIPVKDMLTHRKLLDMDDKYRGVPFDTTLLDIIRQASRWPLKEVPALAQSILPQLEKMMDGMVFIGTDNEFYVRKHDGREIIFSVEAEGFKKIGLLWQLLMNESITEGSVLLWDEPDANINPKFIPALVDSLLELARHGVQIFLGTHSYFLAKYFDVRQQPTDNILVHSLYFSGDSIACETNKRFIKLKHNAILRAFDVLVEEVYGISADDD